MSPTSKSKTKTKRSKRPQFSSPLTSQLKKYDENDNDKGKGRRQRNDSDEDNSNFNGNESGKFNEAKRARLEAEEEEERRLTSLLFGGGNSNSNVNDNGGGVDDVHASAWHDDDDDDDEEDDGHGDGDAGLGLFTIDRNAVDADDDSNSDSDSDDHDEARQSDADNYDGSGKNANANESACAWVDDDDEGNAVSVSLQTSSDRVKKLRRSMAEDVIDGSTYEQRLRDRFQSTASATSRIDWAQLPNKKEEGNKDDDDQDGSGSDSEDDHDHKNKKDDDNGIDTDDDDSDDDDDLDEYTHKANRLLSSTASLLAADDDAMHARKLQPNILNVVRCPDANAGHYSQGTVRSVRFHPGSDDDEPLMFTAGMDKTLRFFKINGTEGSQKIHGIHFPRLPIHSAEFLGDTGNVVVSGRRPFFYIYDMIAGKIDKIPRIQGRHEKSLEKFTTSPDGSLIAFIGNDGYIILVEAKSKMWVADLKMNGTARAVSFSYPDGDFVIASGSDGDVYRWDIRSSSTSRSRNSMPMSVVDRFHNEDGTITSFLSQSSRFTAVGAESGVVNLYNNHDTYNYNYNDRGATAPSSSSSLLFQNDNTRTPVKSIKNLHTSVDFMRFNPSGDILAISSQRERDSLKMVHVPTQTVFSNWPTSKTPLGYVYSVDFSPRSSKFMAIGNDKGKCLLYKLSHYDD